MFLLLLQPNMTSTYKSQNGTAKLLGFWSSEHCRNACSFLVRPGSSTHPKIKNHLGTQQDWTLKAKFSLPPCSVDGAECSGCSASCSTTKSTPAYWGSLLHTAQGHFQLPSWMRLFVIYINKNKTKKTPTVFLHYK